MEQLILRHSAVDLSAKVSPNFCNRKSQGRKYRDKIELMAGRNSFQERLARVQPRNRRTTRQQAGIARDTAESWLLTAIADIFLNGWMFFLSSVAFTVLGCLVFLDFIGLEVGTLIALALAAFWYFVIKFDL